MYCPKAGVLKTFASNYLIRTLVRTSPSFNKGTTSPITVFDRQAKYLQRERAANFPEHEVFDYLKEEIGFRLADRILDIKKELHHGLDLGCGKGFASKNILDSSLKHLFMTDHSPSMLELAQQPEGIPVTKKVVDEEAPLPFESKSLDIVLSNLSFHWVNNIPGCLKEIYRILKDDGVFLASMFGGDTLYQLRSSLVLAELEREGGFASHVSPFTEIKDIGGLLNQTGFTMLTIDTDEVTVRYPSIFELMWDLKGMGENNASVNRKLHLHRDTLMAAAALCEEMYGEDGSVPATFQVIYMIGWKPDPKKAPIIAERGSGQISLKDIHKLDEMIKNSGMEGRIKFMEEADKKDEDDDENNKK